MTRRVLRPLLVTYGGGHAGIMVRLAGELTRRGHEPTVLALTTARAVFRRAGIAASGAELLLDGSDQPFCAMAQQFIERPGHPEVSEAESVAYFAVGIRELVEDRGETEALSLVRARGRTAFLPVRAFERLITRLEPDVVVTTTSPRFELAAARAARRLGTASIAVSDLFLTNERHFIAEGGYAADLTLITERLVSELVALGIDDVNFHVLGNPAFDVLAPSPQDGVRRSELRRERGLSDKTVILVPGAAVTASAVYPDRRFSSAHDVAEALEPACAARGDLTYVWRPHPNAPSALPSACVHGITDPGWSAREALLVADVVIVELSTMGLEAALMGKPVITAGWAREAVYPAYGLAHEVSSLTEAVALVLSGDTGWCERLTPAQLAMPPLGTATDAVVDLIVRRAGGGAGS